MHRSPASPDPSIRADVRTLLRAEGPVVLVAPHPDDEVLGLGGSLSILARDRREVLVVAVTDGGASHPGSTAWPEARLLERRPRESRRAMARLHPGARCLRLGLADGRVQRDEAWLARRLAQLCKGAAALFLPWRRDGHPDHEACGRSAWAAAREVGVPAYEYPVWGLVRGHPAHRALRGHALRELAVDASALAAKRAAIRRFASQLAADPSTGRGPVLPPPAVRAWSQPREIVLA